MNKKNIKIMLIKSGIGRKSDQKQTLIGLGLTRVGKVRELEDTPSVRGMVKKVSHLVKII
ncbi:MAG: 50S ribosomal protein L30 [SAR116 cluster bacterium]|nr:50S ribosomal protein L30 [SAR116 cluster bacterium]RPH08015.1 MAG: 50S ribosomal protein L30 [Alphaproteobacteria bacterium TMED54]